MFLAYENLSEALQLIEELKNLVQDNHTDFLVVQAKYWSLCKAPFKVIALYK
ncbi:MAG: hypothetical protein ACMUEL_09705 [Flavobacteriales bacterium Tduv]